MAGNVQSNIHLNFTSNGEETLKRFNNVFYESKDIIDSCINQPLNITEDIIKKLEANIVKLVSEMEYMKSIGISMNIPTPIMMLRLVKMLMFVSRSILTLMETNTWTKRRIHTMRDMISFCIITIPEEIIGTSTTTLG